MVKDNLACILHKEYDIRMEQKPIPVPKEGEVLLEMGCVGICGSDVHYYEHGRIADYIVTKPMTIGHEASGTVVKLGPGVKHLKPGDRVAIEPGVPCRCCSFCKEGRYNLCYDVIFCATPPHDGNLSRFYTHAADFCYKLPDHLSLQEGALLEPLAVGVHACKRSGVGLGTSVLVLSAGPIGLVTILAAKAYGARVICVTRSLVRLNMAKECGADAIIQVKDYDKEGSALIPKIHAALGGAPEVTIDCTGLATCLTLGINVTRPGGKVMMVGMGPESISIPMVNACSKEIDILSCFRYANDYPTALEMVASGKCPVTKLITHNFKLEEAVDAFKTASKKSDDTIKIMIHCRSG
uniref:Sorbitol dehydrogenase n=2 Tax=Cacopsylla melanoneura TaxID=428564 RepID=A0A8D8U444_9HEMI